MTKEILNKLVIDGFDDNLQEQLANKILEELAQKAKIKEGWEGIADLFEEVMDSILKYEKTGVVSKIYSDEYLIDQDLIDQYAKHIQEDTEPMFPKEQTALLKELQYLMDENYNIDGYILINETLFKQIVESIINKLDIKKD